MTEKNQEKVSYIPDGPYTYVISSFFAANKNVMHKLNEKIIYFTRLDLTRATGYHIPPFMDENYFNSIVYDFEHGRGDDYDFGVSVKQYSELYNADNIENNDVFIYQKNFPNYKTNRR